MTIENAPSCLKVSEVAVILRVSRAHAYQLVKSEGFPRIAIGRRFIVPRDAFIEWINQNTQTAG